MKNLRDKDIAMVFVGCGGTFWTSSPYFSSLVKAIQPKSLYCVDPDILTEANTERQWCTEQAITGESKACIAASVIEVTQVTSLYFHGMFQDFVNTPDIQEQLEDMMVLVIVNVDNNDARLAIREWCIAHTQTAIMVMSGCDLNYGQVYYGVYGGRSRGHDWLPLHPDVDGSTPPIQREDDGCGAQSAMSNFMTGALFAPAIEEAVNWFDATATKDPDKVGEWYWRREDGKTKVWTSFAVATGTGVAQNV